MQLTIKNLALNYSYKSVLKNVSVQFQSNQIHGILGENGAGKSSLAKIISGELLPDDGEILCEYDDSTKRIFPARNFSVKKSLSNGICYVHQRPLLAENASIYENVILGLKTVDKKDIENLMKTWMPKHSEKTLVKDIGGDCNFFTALICALLKKPKLLILDEPCALLDDEQTDFLYTNLRKLADAGMNILVITHSKKEAKKYCDTVTILDDGYIVFNDDSKKDEWENHFLNTLIEKGETDSLSVHNSTKHKTSSDFFLRFNELNCKPVNKAAIVNVNLSAVAGKITLISGLTEDGIETLEDVICGMETNSFTGSIYINNPAGKNFSLEFKHNNYNTHILRTKTGSRFGIIPSDKTFRASNPNLTIKQILSFTSVSPKELIEKAEIKISENEKVSCLSGGMLQRLILQRELSLNPDILIFCEPLQGLDFAASEKICKTLTELSEMGKIILILSSSEFPKNFCSSIYKLKAGKIYMEGAN